MFVLMKVRDSSPIPPKAGWFGMTSWSADYVGYGGDSPPANLPHIHQIKQFNCHSEPRLKRGEESDLDEPICYVEDTD